MEKRAVNLGFERKRSEEDRVGEAKNFYRLEFEFGEEMEEGMRVIALVQW